MKKLFALVSISALLLQVSSIGVGSAQTPPQGQQVSQTADKSADTYNRMGLAKSKSKDFQGAIADYTIAIRINSQFATAYANRGVAKLYVGDKDGAVVDWTKASELYRQQGKMSRYEEMLARINKFSTAISDEGLKQGWTSISQLKDVQPSDRYYQATKSLVERYAVVSAYNDNKFYGQRPLTRGQLVSFLGRSLQVLTELIDLASNDNKQVYIGIGFCSNKPEVLNEIFCKDYSLYKNNVTSLSQIKDVKSTDAYFFELQYLTERYNINTIDADNYFRASKSVTKKEFYDLMNGIFKYRSVDLQSISKEPLTRGEFVIVLNDVLNRANEKIGLLQK